MRIRVISLNYIFLGVFVLIAAVLAMADEKNSPDWRTIDLPFRAVDITSLQHSLWVCGTDESIASSSDNGSSWKVKHHTADGGILLNIALANDKCGYASGTGGLFLITEDGGESWVSHP